MFIRIFFLILVSVFAMFSVSAQTSREDLNIREINVGDTGTRNSELEQFIAPIRNFFFNSDAAGGEAVLDGFILIAYNIKNFFIAIAVIFLIIGVIKLLFSSNSEEDVARWRRSIIWTTVGIIVMQIAFSIWNTLRLTSRSDVIGSSLGWEFWVKIFGPIVNMMQIVATLGFLLMAIYAFYVMVTAAISVEGNEARVKKARRTIFYAIAGFLLIRIPYMFVRALYGRPGCEKSSTNFVTLGTCDIKEVDLTKGIGLVGKIFTYFNTFLAIICVILILYAGWLVFISGGEEEKLKKAKSTIIYVVIGLIVLVASHAIFRFFILKG